MCAMTCPDFVLTRKTVFDEINCGSSEENNSTTFNDLIGLHWIIAAQCLCSLDMSNGGGGVCKHVPVESYDQLYDMFVELYYSDKYFCETCNTVSVYTRVPHQCHWRYLKRDYLQECSRMNTNNYYDCIENDSDDSGIY